MPIPSICWPAALTALLALEATMVGLASLWFVVDSLCALLISFFVGSIQVQFAVLLTASFLYLAIIRSLAKKYVDPRRESTNADQVIGAEDVVIQAVDNLKAQGQIIASSASQTARTEEGCSAIPVGPRARVLRIEGIKVIVLPSPAPTLGR